MALATRLSVAGLILAALTATPLVSADSVEDGKKSFQLGVALLQDPDGAKYDEALPHFKRAYELTKNWKVLGNLGLCYLKLERVGEAVDTYERYLQGGGAEIDAEERGQIEKDVAVLKAQRVKFHVDVPAAGLTLNDERIKPNGSKVLNVYPLSSAGADLSLYAGRHVMTVVIDQQPVKWESDLAPGATLSHKFERPAPAPTASASAAAPPTATAATPPSASMAIEPRPPSGIGLPVYIAGGATVAMALGTAITGALYLGRRSDYNAINGKPDRSRQEAEDARSKASTMQTVSTVFGVATVVGLGVTTYLFLTGDSSSNTTTGKTRVSPWLSPYGGGFAVGGAL